MTRRKMVARNVVSTIVNQFAIWMLTFWVTIKLPGYLGPVGLGQFAIAFSVAGVAALVIGLGTSTVLVREIARDHSRTSDLIPSALALRAPLSVVALLISLCASMLLHYSSRVVILVTLAEAALVVGAISEVMGSALQGLEQLPKLNLGQFFERLVYSVGTLVLLTIHAPVWALIAISILGAFCGLVLNVVMVWPYVGKMTRPTLKSIRDLLYAGLPFATTSVFSGIYSQCDPPILNQLGTVSMSGWYSLGRRLLGAVLFFPAALTSALLPTLSRLYREDPGSFTPTVKRMVNLVLIAVVPFAFLLIFGPWQVLVLLHCKKGFDGSVPVMQVFGAGFVTWYLSQVVGASLVASDRQRALSRIAGVAAIFSAPLCIIFVLAAQSAWHAGAVGAAVSDVAVESYLLVSYVRAASDPPLDGASAKVFVRAIVAALPLAFLLYATNGSTSMGTILIAGAVGAAAYVPLCLILRCCDPQDLSMIREMVSRRLDGRANGV